MSDTTKWVFTLNERRKTLDHSFRNGDPVGVAQAIIEYHPTQPFDINICFEDESNSKKHKDPQPPGKTTSRWLEQAATNNSLDYVRLFASRGARQQALNDALGIALSNNSRPIIEQLLRYGADPNDHSQAFQSAVGVNDIELVSLILQACSSKALNSNQLHPALLTAIQMRSYHMAALLLAHGANPGHLSGQPLVTAIQSQDLRMLSLILVGCSEIISSELLAIATSVACELQDISLKVSCLELLLCAGAPTESQIICNQLCVAVKTNQLDYISMLIQRGISPDYNEAEAVQLAVNELKVECLQKLSKGTLSTSNASKAIDGIPENVSEELALGIVGILFEKGADCKGRGWGRLLVVAVENCYQTLITTLVDHGTSIDYENSRVVRIVLRRNNLDLLQLLLHGRSTSQILAKALPDAIHVTEKEKRRRAILMLLDKGAKGPEMNIALLQAVTSSTLRDLEVVKALLQQGASVNHVDRNGNCIKVAVDKGDLELLSIFCDHNPSDRILSAAIRVAFDSMGRIPQSDVLRIMDLLMSKGARGPEIAQTLVEIVRGNDIEILNLLLRRGADVNQQGGLVIEEALKTTSVAALEEICKISRIEQETFTRLISLALTASDNDSRAILLIRACRKYRGELSRILIKVVSQFDGREGLVKALLQNGATVNYDNGKALCHAVHSGNVKLVDWLTVDLELETLSAVFRIATGVEDPKLRHEIMTILLRGTSKGKKFGQDDALVFECQRGPKASLDSVNLLLQHDADVDHLKGAAIQQAVSAKSSELLRLLFSRQPNQTSLCTAFKTAREVICSLEKRLELFKALLEKGYRGNQINQALVEAISRSPKDEEIPRLLLEYEAEVDFDSGLPLILAARSGNTSLLRFLISKSSNPSSLENSFRSARHASMSDVERLSVYSTLLDTKSVSQDEISAALIDTVSAKTIDMKLIWLLLGHNVSLEFNGGDALCILVKRSDFATAALLLENQLASTKTLNRAFELCFELDRICRLSFANLLVPKGVSQTLLTGYLNQIVADKDHNLVQLFVQYGADVEFGGGKALVTAASSGDRVSLQILLSNRVRVELINAAFEGMLASRAPDKYSGGAESARSLLEHGVSQMLKDRALLEAVEYYCNQGNVFVRTLMEHGANVNVAEGRCFVITGGFENYELFDAMLGFKPQLDTIIPALVKGIEDEGKLVALIRRCFTYQSPHFDSANNAILFVAIKHFPRGANLVELLLDSNCPAGVTQALKLKANYESEDVTPLVWSLYQTDPVISDSVMLTLLTRGQEG
jgi:ankyrin repeat protein